MHPLPNALVRDKIFRPYLLDATISEMQILLSVNKTWYQLTAAAVQGLRSNKETSYHQISAKFAMLPAVFLTPECYVKKVEWMKSLFFYCSFKKATPPIQAFSIDSVQEMIIKYALNQQLEKKHSSETKPFPAYDDILMYPLSKTIELQLKVPLKKQKEKIEHCLLDYCTVNSTSTESHFGKELSSSPTELQEPKKIYWSHCEKLEEALRNLFDIPEEGRLPISRSEEFMSQIRSNHIRTLKGIQSIDTISNNIQACKQAYAGYLLAKQNYLIALKKYSGWPH